MPTLVGASAAAPEALFQKSELSADERGQVRSFAEGLISGLGSDDASKARAARDELLAPLAKGVSVPFRLEMSNALQQPLIRMVASANDRVAFNAARVAGAVATSGMIDVVRAALGDARAAVRYGGAFASRQMLEEQAAKRSPIDQAQARGLLRAVAETLRADADPAVVDGLVSATEAAAADTRSEAMTLMCRSLAEQALTFGRKERGGDPDTWARAFRRGVRASQAALLDQLRTGKPDEAFAKATAEMAGAMLAHVARRVEAARKGVRSESEVETLRDLVADAEGTLIFVNENLAPGAQKTEQRLRAAFEAEMNGGEDAAGQVAAEAAAWIGAGGVLTKPPYGFEASRFVPR